MKGTPGRNIPEALRRYRDGYDTIKWKEKMKRLTGDPICPIAANR